MAIMNPTGSYACLVFLEWDLEDCCSASAPASSVFESLRLVLFRTRGIGAEENLKQATSYVTRRCNVEQKNVVVSFSISTHSAYTSSQVHHSPETSLHIRRQFPASSSKYPYFNQPITQDPTTSRDRRQFANMTRRTLFTLMWWTIETCINISC